MPKTKRQRIMTPEGRMRQLRALRHNGMTGHVSMMRAQLNMMLSSDSLTPEAHEIASKMYQMTADLIQHLKTRVDPPS